MTWNITPASLKAVCRENKLYYHKPELNDVMYLHYKGITKLENLEAFSGLKALYLEGNAISVIENMQHMTELRSLFMSKNILHGLDGIQQLSALATLDVSHNDLYSLAPLSCLVSLQSLNASHNKLSVAEDISSLLHCVQLKTLDLEKNRIACPDALDTIMTMPLALLRLVGNLVVSNTKNYRKMVMVQMPQLENLDDMPCFPKDRRLAEVFMRGGAQAEAAERIVIKQEERQARENSRQAFNDMVARAKEEAAQRAVQQAALAEAAESTATNIVTSAMQCALEKAAQYSIRAAQEAKVKQQKADDAETVAQLVKAAIQAVALEQEQLQSSLTQQQSGDECADVSSSASTQDILLDARDYSSSSVCDVDLQGLTAQNYEMEKKLVEMHVRLVGTYSGAGEPAEPAHESEHSITNQGALSVLSPSVVSSAFGGGTTAEASKEDVQGCNAGLLADLLQVTRSPGQAADTSVTPSHVAKRKSRTAVWNTSRYKELWSLALEAGDAQEQDRTAPQLMSDSEDIPCVAECSGDLGLSSGTGQLHVDCMDGDGPDGMISVPLGTGLMDSIVGASSDGSETKIGAHYPSTNAAADFPEVAS